MTTHIWYHKDCADGFTAAWLAWRHMDGSEKFEFRPCQYGEDLAYVNVPANEDFIFLLDFHLPLVVLEELDKRVAFLRVFDHHKSFLKEMTEHPMFSEDRGDEKRTYYLDQDKCGARLFLDWLLSEEGQEWCENRPAVRSEVDLLVDYVEDRNLWKHQLSHTKEIQAYIMSRPYTFEAWRSMNNLLVRDPGVVIQCGTTVLNLQQKQKEMLLRNSSTLSLLSYTIPVINSPVLQSELGHELLQKFSSAPFSAVYWVGEASLLPVRFSLRSEDNRVDVSEIAKRMGGGGHRNAAGFHCSLSTLYDLLS